MWISDLLAPAQAAAWVSGLTGAIGATLGSLVTILWTEWFNKRTFNRERKERQLGVMFSTLHRLNRIYSNSLEIRKHLNSQMDDASSSGAQYFSLRVLPITQVGDRIEFPVEELWVLGTVGGGRLINSVSALDYRYNSLVGNLELYHEGRAPALEILQPTSIDDNAAATDVTKEIFLKLSPKLIELDSILIQTRPIAEELVKDTFGALRELVFAKKSPLSRDFMIELPDPEGRVIQLKAQNAPHRRARVGWTRLVPELRSSKGRTKDSG